MRETLHIDEEFASLLRANSLDRLDAVLKCGGGERLDKPGLQPWRQRWRLDLSTADGSRQSVYLKRFERPPLRDQWQRWRQGFGRHASAYVEWANARALAQKGIPAVRVMAVGEQMLGPLELASCVLLEEVKGESLERWAQRCRSHESHRFGPEMTTALARFVARFHDGGFVHRDLYLCHLFLRTGRCGDRPDDYVLIDLQRVFQPRWRRFRWVVKDLAALAFSTPSQLLSSFGRLRFLVSYCRALDGSIDARRLAPRVVRRLARMHRRSARSAKSSLSSSVPPPRSAPNLV